VRGLPNKIYSRLTIYFVQILGKEWVLPESVVLERNDRLLTSLAKRCQQWQFVGQFFADAARNVSVGVPVMPWLTFLTIETGVVPSLDECAVLFPLVPYCRLYQFYTAFLLEMDCGLKLCSYGVVKKVFALDLTEGVDWLVGDLRVAVVHGGAVSRRYYLSKKRSKQQVDVVLFASEGKGLHLVSFQEISEKIRPYSVA
jgi:hypothetical protein